MLTSFIPAVVRAEIIQNITSLVAWVKESAKAISLPLLSVRITAGAEAANVRRLTLRVVNSKGDVCGGLYLVDVWIAATSAGAPGGSQTVSLVTGALYQTVGANVALRLITSASGEIVLDVDAGGGAQSRYVRAVVVGPAVSTATDPLTWA
jgi:hypothetical protein